METDISFTLMQLEIKESINWLNINQVFKRKYIGCPGKIFKYEYKYEFISIDKKVAFCLQTKQPMHEMSNKHYLKVSLNL